MWMDNGISNWILENISIYEGLNKILKIIFQINGFGLLWLGAIIVFMYLNYKKTKKLDLSYIYHIIPVLIGICVVVFIIAPIFNRPHPYDAIQGFIDIKESLSLSSKITSSLPSISAFTSIGYTFVLVNKEKKHKTYYFIACFVMCAIELILGISYLSDLLFGAGLGLIFASIGNAIIPAIEKLIKKIKGDIK